MRYIFILFATFITAALANVSAEKESSKILARENGKGENSSRENSKWANIKG